MSGFGGAGATRSEIVQSRRRLERVVKGTRLLQRKREALVTELFRLARPAADTRARIDALAREAYPALLAALAEHGHAGLRALAWPGRDITVEIAPGQVWGIVVSHIVRRPPVQRTLAARGTPPGSAGAAAIETAARFEALLDLLLEAAPTELLIRRLGEALAETSRRVHTLERRVTPGLRERIAVAQRALDERERDERTRLKRVVARLRRQESAV